MIAPRVLTILAFIGWIGAGPAVMPFTTLARGDRSQIEEPRQVAVRTAAEWAGLWKEHAGTGEKPPPLDFTRSMVVGVFAGSRPTAGYSVEITGVEKRAARLVVRYREQAPAPDAIVAQVLTSPFHIVRTQLESGPVSFERAAPER